MDFYFVLFVVVAVTVLYVAFKVVGNPAPASARPSARSAGPSQRPSPATVIFENQDWLDERWRLAAADDIAKRTDMFPRWYFSEPTERQLEYLYSLGGTTRANHSKGQVSDLIGLFKEPDEADLAVLKFFKASTSSLNQTRARHEAAMLLRDPEKAKAWEQRPPDTEQRECLKFFGLPVTKSTTHAVAANVIATLMADLSEKDDPRLAEWESYENVLAEFDDADNLREMYEIKRPSATLLRQAISELRAEGVTLAKMYGEPDLVRDRLLKLKPELSRPFDD
ncbi:MAG: hypothetical protein K2X67_03420 [Burkholderiales bacterium]|nr:hypothetical protein [Burkholderiales bacterium]